MKSRRNVGLLGRAPRLPSEARVLDAMGNGPWRDGKKTWEIGMQPLFVLSSTLPAARLAEVCARAVGSN